MASVTALPVIRDGCSIAAADLSALQYTFVKKNSTGGIVAVAAATDIPYGVLQNKPTSGGVCDIVLLGGTLLKAGALINAGVLIGTGSTGKAVALAAGTDGTKYLLGQLCDGAGADGDIVAAVVNCINPARAA